MQKIQVTEAARAALKRRLDAHPGVVGIRLGLKNAGCNGLTYTLDFEHETQPTDRVFEEAGLKVIVQEDHLQHLAGTTLDYVTEGLNASFKFLNPNVKSECGCGESFSVEK